MEEETGGEDGNKHKEKNNGQTEKKKKKALKQSSVRFPKIIMLVRELNHDCLAGVRMQMAYGGKRECSPHYSPDRLVGLIVNSNLQRMYICVLPHLKPNRHLVCEHDSAACDGAARCHDYCMCDPTPELMFQHVATQDMKVSKTAKRGRTAQTGTEAAAVENASRKEREYKFLRLLL